mgnify:CR=1 FL=1
MDRRQLLLFVIRPGFSYPSAAPHRPIRELCPIFRRFEALFQPLDGNGAVIRVLCDTYVREIERYGANTMEPVERLFGIDSGAILELLEKIEELPTDTRENDPLAVGTGITG